MPCMYELTINSFISSLTTYERFCVTLIIWMEKLRKTEVRNLDKVIDTSLVSGPESEPSQSDPVTLVL